MHRRPERRISGRRERIHGHSDTCGSFVLRSSIVEAASPFDRAGALRVVVPDAYARSRRAMASFNRTKLRVITRERAVKRPRLRGIQHPVFMFIRARIYIYLRIRTFTRERASEANVITHFCTRESASSSDIVERSCPAKAAFN